jgi:hypothetical protein
MPIKLEDDDPLRTFHWYDHEHTPSWQRNNNTGYASMDVRTHVRNPHLTFVITERGDKSSRETIITLNPAEGFAFLEWLRDLYAPQNKPCGGPASSVS